MHNFNLSFILTTEDSYIDMTVEAPNEDAAVQMVYDRLSEEIDDDQRLSLNYVRLVEPSYTPMSPRSTGYTSLASLYSAPASTSTVEASTTTLPQIPGYNRLVN